MEKHVFRWIENLRGDCYPERAMQGMPNHNADRTIETHELTMWQERMTLDELVRQFPKPKRVRSLQ